MTNFSLIPGFIRSAVFLLALLALASCSKDETAGPAPGPGPSTEVFPSRDGLAMYLPFNGGVADSSALHLSGTPTNATPATDRFGDTARAASFNGSNSMVIYGSFPPDTANGGTALTLAAWIYPTTLQSSNIVRRGTAPTGPYGLGLSQTGVAFSGPGDITFHMAGASTNGARKSGYPLNTWTFVAGTYDGVMMRLYVNGVQADSIPGPAKIMAEFGYSPIVIGTRLQLPADTFNGSIDDVLIYHRTLSATELTKLYTATRR